MRDSHPSSLTSRLTSFVCPTFVFSHYFRHRQYLYHPVLVILFLFVLLLYFFSSFAPTFNVIHYAVSSASCVPVLATARIENMVRHVCSELNSRNLTYWLMDGTLLGITNSRAIPSSSFLNIFPQEPYTQMVPSFAPTTMAISLTCGRTEWR